MFINLLSRSIFSGHLSLSLVWMWSLQALILVSFSNYAYACERDVCNGISVTANNFEIITANADSQVAKILAKIEESSTNVYYDVLDHVDEVCNMVALRDQAERVMGSDAMEFKLLNQSVNDACNWLKAFDPDSDDDTLLNQCIVDFRYYCTTNWSRLNKLVRLCRSM